MPSPSIPLEERIEAILREAGEAPLSLRQIKEKLGTSELDHFEVRDAVWKLIDKGRADLTPRRYVKAVGS